MALLKRTNNGFINSRSLLSDFLETNRHSNESLWNKSPVPAVNVSENEKNYAIEVVAPGIKKNDFKIRVEKNTLIISAEKKEEKQEKEKKEKNYIRQEYTYNSFSRLFTLPNDVKGDDIKAHYEDGVLKLSIARQPAAALKAKEIAVA
jgi:HSP20 family protein